MSKSSSNSSLPRYRQLGKTSVQLIGSPIKIVTVDNNASTNNNNNQATETRMLLLIGGSGHGKTKLLNVFVNYLYDVKLSDNLRYFISEDDDNAYTINSSTNRTRQITKYIFNGTRLPYRLIVVDTPGISSADNRSNTVQLISDWIQKEHQSQSRLNAIGIVTKGTETRVTTQMRNEFEQIFALFPSDMRQHSFIYLLTFCDASQQPAIGALNDMNLDCHSRNTFTFNNSAFTVQNGQLSKLQEMLWSHSMHSADALFKLISKMPSQSIRAPIPRPRRYSSSSKRTNTDIDTSNEIDATPPIKSQSDTNRSSTLSSPLYDPNPRVNLPPSIKLSNSKSTDISTSSTTKQYDPNPRVHLRPQTLAIAPPLTIDQQAAKLRPPPPVISNYRQNNQIDRRITSVTSQQTRTEIISKPTTIGENRVLPSSLRSSRSSTPSRRVGVESVRFQSNHHNDEAALIDSGSIASSTLTSTSVRPLIRNNGNNNRRRKSIAEQYCGRDNQNNWICYGGIIFIIFVVVVLFITLIITLK